MKATYTTNACDWTGTELVYTFNATTGELVVNGNTLVLKSSITLEQSAELNEDGEASDYDIEQRAAFLEFDKDFSFCTVSKFRNGDSWSASSGEYDRGGKTAHEAVARLVANLI